jgi:hypothetical protein
MSHGLAFTIERDEDWKRLVEYGRFLVASKGVVYPMGPWSDEQYARYAVTSSLSDALHTHGKITPGVMA